jgi:LmbE family N-acetylglucosaminyl deacetylase
MDTIETPERAMLVIPHPDDGESGCGGTVAKWVREGCEVLYVVCTNGDKGSSDLEMTSVRLAQIRALEQKKATEVLGVQDLVMLGYGDGELEDTSMFRGQIVEQIRRFRPEVLLAMDPRRMAHSHRDHRISGQTALDAAFPFARDVLHYPQHLSAGYETHKVASVLLWGSEAPDVVVDITDTVDLKMHALAAHESQLSTDMVRIEQFTKRRAVDAAAEAENDGFKFQYAEIFRRINFRG